MSKKYRIALTVIGIFLILLIALSVSVKIFGKSNDKKATVKTSVVDEMDKYGYFLDDRDTKIFKQTYYELKEILENEEIDYKLYGEKLSQLFVIDLFTISNKISKYDVGGLEYIYKEEQDMFKNKVMDTLYEHVEDNSYGTRNQKLPTVKSVITDDVEETTYKVDEKKLDAYKYFITIEYEEDLDYDKKCSVEVVKDNEVMYVVEYTAIK